MKKLILIVLLLLICNPVFAAISFVNSSSTANAGSTSCTVAKPTNTVDGDFMIVLVGVNVFATTITPPSGWTLLQSNTNATLSSAIHVYYRIASGEGADYTFTVSSSQRNSCGMASFRGVNNTSPVDLSSKNVTLSTTTTNYPATAITTTQNNEWIVYLANLDDPNTRSWTAHSGYTEALDMNSINSISITYLSQVTAGDTGTITGVASGTGSYGIAFLVGLKEGAPVTKINGAIINGAKIN